MRQIVCVVGAVVLVLLALGGGCRPTVSVAGTVPGGGASGVEPGSAIRVEFDRPVPRVEMEKAFSIEPGVEGRFSWEANVLVFQPVRPLEEGSTYHVRIRHPALRGGEYRFSFATASAQRPGDEPPAPPVGEQLDLQVRRTTGVWRVSPPAADVEFTGSAAWLDDSSGLMFLLVRRGEKVAGLLDLQSAIVTRVFSLPEGPEFVYMSGMLGQRRGAVFLVMPPEGTEGLPALWQATLAGTQKVLREGVSHFSLSPDGRRLILFRLEKEAVPELLDFGTGKETPLPSVPSYDWPYTAVGLTWSPDGSFVAGEKWQKNVSLYIVDAQTGRLVRELGENGEFYFYAQWSPDNRHLAFLATPAADVVWSGWDEWPLPIATSVGLVEVASGRVSFVPAPQGRIVDAPVWSPAGNCFAFAAGVVEKNEEAPFGHGPPADLSELWLCVLEGRKPVVSRLTDATSGKGSKRVVAWLPGGNEIVFSVGSSTAEPYTGELWIVDAGSGAQRKLDLGEGERIHVLPDGRLLTVAAGTLVRFDPATQAREVLAKGISSLAEFTVSPDGRLAQYFSEGARRELVIVELGR